MLFMLFNSLFILYLYYSVDRRVKQEIGQLRGNLTLGQRAARQKLMFFGHVMRSDGLEKEMMLACGEGERRRGRPRKRWMEEIHEKMKMNLEELREATRDANTR